MSVDIQTLDVSQFPIFKDVQPDVARKFLASGFTFRYAAGMPVIVNHDLGETFFIIINGMATIVLINARDEAVNVTLFKTGDFFGELSILESEPVRTANVVAATDLEVVGIQKSEFLKLLHQHPELGLNLARVLGRRIRAMNDRMVALTLPDMHRVARTMLHLARQGKAFNEDGPVLLPSLPLKDWVLFCNTSQEKFMQIMEHLRAAGALEWQNQRIAVKNLQLLSQMSQPLESRATLDDF